MKRLYLVPLGLVSILQFGFYIDWYLQIEYKTYSGHLTEFTSTQSYCGVYVVFIEMSSSGVTSNSGPPAENTIYGPSAPATS